MVGLNDEFLHEWEGHPQDVDAHPSKVGQDVDSPLHVDNKIYIKMLEYLLIVDGGMIGLNEKNSIGIRVWAIVLRRKN